MNLYRNVSIIDLLFSLCITFVSIQFVFRLFIQAKEFFCSRTIVKICFVERGSEKYALRHTFESANTFYDYAEKIWAGETSEQKRRKVTTDQDDFHLNIRRFYGMMIL